MIGDWPWSVVELESLRIAEFKGAVGSRQVTNDNDNGPSTSKRQMVFTDLLLDTLRTLWAHKLRTFLTMFGIAWGIISITLMVAAGEGLRVGQQRQNETFGKDLMIFFEGRTSMQAGGLRAGREVTLGGE